MSQDSKETKEIKKVYITEKELDKYVGWLREQDKDKLGYWKFEFSTMLMRLGINVGASERYEDPNGELEDITLRCDLMRTDARLRGMSESEIESEIANIKPKRYSTRYFDAYLHIEAKELYDTTPLVFDLYNISSNHIAMKNIKTFNIELAMMHGVKDMSIEKCEIDALILGSGRGVVLSGRMVVIMA